MSQHSKSQHVNAVYKLFKPSVIIIFLFVADENMAEKVPIKAILMPIKAIPMPFYIK